MNIFFCDIPFNLNFKGILSNFANIFIKIKKFNSNFDKLSWKKVPIEEKFAFAKKIKIILKILSFPL